MAAINNRKRSVAVDYRQLNGFSSVVLYDMARHKNRARKTEFYTVDRVIERRQAARDYEYLIKSRDWPYEGCTWEPGDHLTAECLRSYDNPSKPPQCELEEMAKIFENGILSYLKSHTVKPCYIENFHLNIWRFISNGKGEKVGTRGCSLFERSDFSKFSTLSSHWWYCLNEHGEGTAIDFPVRIKPLLSWTSNYYVFDGQAVVKAPKRPKEKLLLTLTRRPCTFNNL